MPLTPIEVLNRIVEDAVPTLRLTAARTLANLRSMNRIKSVRKTTLDWDIDVGGGGVAIEALTADNALTQVDTVVPAQLRIGTHRIKHSFEISRVAIQEAAQVAPEDLKDLFQSHVIRGMTHIMREVNRLIYQGAANGASANVIGLNHIVNTANLVYAGIDPATYTAWRPITLANAGTPRNLTRDLMLDFDQLVFEQETFYDMVFMSPATAKAYTKVFDSLGGAASLAINTDDANFRNIDLGHGGRSYNGIPISEDPMMSSGRIYFLNSMDIDLFFFEMDSKPNGSANAPTNTNLVVNKSFGMPIHIAELPSNNSAKRVFELFTIPQLRVRNLKSFQAILDLN